MELLKILENGDEIWLVENEPLTYVPNVDAWHCAGFPCKDEDYTGWRQEALAKMPKRVEFEGYVEEYYYGEEFDCEVRFSEITQKKIIQELPVFQELFVPRKVTITIEEVQE